MQLQEGSGNSEDSYLELESHTDMLFKILPIKQTKNNSVLANKKHKHKFLVLTEEKLDKIRAWLKYWPCKSLMHFA